MAIWPQARCLGDRGLRSLHLFLSLLLFALLCCIMRAERQPKQTLSEWFTFAKFAFRIFFEDNLWPRRDRFVRMEQYRQPCEEFLEFFSHEYGIPHPKWDHFQRMRLSLVRKRIFSQPGFEDLKASLSFVRLIKVIICRSTLLYCVWLSCNLPANDRNFPKMRAITF